MEARVSGFDVASANFRQSQAARRYSSTVSMGLPLVSPIPEVEPTKKRFFPFPLRDKIFFGHGTISPERTWGVTPERQAQSGRCWTPVQKMGGKRGRPQWRPRCFLDKGSRELCPYPDVDRVPGGDVLARVEARCSPSPGRSQSAGWGWRIEGARAHLIGFACYPARGPASGPRRSEILVRFPPSKPT